MKISKNILFSTFAAILGVFAISSCKSDNDNIAKAVLCSANTLTFEGQKAEGQMVTVYADAKWTCTAPDWVTVSPATGDGTTDVTITVSDNVRGGSLDNPRKDAVVFKGATLASQASLEIVQKGDKYRDVKNFTVTEIAAAADETVIIVPKAQVTAITTKGYVISDDKTAVYVPVAPGTLAVGDVISFKGDKGSESGLPTVTTVDNMTKLSNSAVTYPTPVDINSTIDTYAPTTREYVTALGLLKGNSISVGAYDSSKQFVVDATKAISINVLDAPDALKLASLNGHIVVIEGYFAGVAKPVLNVMASKITDKGAFKTIYFADDFSWMRPYLDEYNVLNPTSPIGDAVGKKDIASVSPNVYTAFVANGSKIMDKFTELGYVDLNPGPKVLYPQDCYWKMGKTGYHTGLELPPFTKLTKETDAIMTFDWCAQLTTAGVVDQPDIHVEIVEGPGSIVTGSGEASVVILPPTDQVAGNAPYDLHWINASVTLKGITAKTRISIYPTPLQTTKDGSVCKRWYIDNIEVGPKQ
jgi:hypothetical protein